MGIKLLILLGYLSILFIIGIISSKKIKNMGDFYVGGKDLGFWVVAFSARATGESGWLLLGLTGMGAVLGLKAMWVVLGEVLGVAACWLLMAKPFKRLTDSYNSMTVTDFFVSHFKCTTHRFRVITSIVLAVFIAIYVSSQIDATGTAFETFFGMNYFLGALIGFAIVLAYIFFGGFVAVAWSDFFQGSMMFLGLVLLPIAAFFHLKSAGMTETIGEKIALLDPSLLSIWGADGLTLMSVMGIIGFLTIGAGFLGSPQVFVRFISIKNEAEITKGTVVAIVFTLLTDAAAVMAGLFGRVILTKAGQLPEAVLGNSAQNVLPMLVEVLFPTVLVGLYIAAVLSAIMSTVDSLLVVASSAICRDIYQKVLNPHKTEAELTNLSRMVTIGISLVSLLIAFVVAILSPTRTIFWFVMFGWSGLAACFCPMMILSLTWKGFNEKGALASMLTGAVCIPFFSFVAPKMAVVGPYIAQLSTLPPSLFVAILVGVIVAKRTTVVA